MHLTPSDKKLGGVAREGNVSLVPSDNYVEGAIRGLRGLNAMEAAGFTHSVIEGLRASTKK